MAANTYERIQPNWRQNRGAWFTPSDYARDLDLKKSAMQKLLGPAAGHGWQARVPFELGGGLDLYPFERALPGTALATMQLIFPDGQGPQRNAQGVYELVACTRLLQAPDATCDPYEGMVERIRAVLTAAARRGYQQMLSPGDGVDLACGQIGRVCVLFDRYTSSPLRIGRKKHHLLLCMEIFAAEFEYARDAGFDRLVERLQAAGHYPYSDLDRPAVV